MDVFTDPSFEIEGDDDDIFYAELKRQILLLTADDDENFLETKHPNSINVITGRGSCSSITSFSSALQPGSYFSLWENETATSVPAWLSNLWRSGNGTGVFIPHTINYRRKQKPGRMKKRMYKRVESK